MSFCLPNFNNLWKFAKVLFWDYVEYHGLLKTYTIPYYVIFQVGNPLWPPQIINSFGEFIDKLYFCEIVLPTIYPQVTWSLDLLA